MGTMGKFAQLRPTIIKRPVMDNQRVINAQEVWALIIFTNQFKQKVTMLAKN